MMSIRGLFITVFIGMATVIVALTVRGEYSRDTSADVLPTPFTHFPAGPTTADITQPASPSNQPPHLFSPSQEDVETLVIDATANLSSSGPMLFERSRQSLVEEIESGIRDDQWSYNEELRFIDVFHEACPAGAAIGDSIQCAVTIRRAEITNLSDIVSPASVPGIYAWGNNEFDVSLVPLKVGGYQMTWDQVDC